jgi:DNA-binding transcriptional MerR regulator
MQKVITGPRAADVSSRFNRSPAWLRKLEYDGIIPPAPRDSFNGRRCYPDSYLQEIETIIRGRQRNAGGFEAA